MSKGLLPSVWVIDLYSISIDSVRNIADFTDQCDDCHIEFMVDWNVRYFTWTLTCVYANMHFFNDL